jgi:hypothetical protein
MASFVTVVVTAARSSGRTPILCSLPKGWPEFFSWPVGPAFFESVAAQHLYCSRRRHLRRRLCHWPDRGIGRLDEVGRIRGGGCGLLSFVRPTAAGQLVGRLVTMIHSVGFAVRMDR